MKKILSLVLAVALCLSLLTTSAFAVDEHEKDYLDKQVQLVVDNLQKFYEDKPRRAIHTVTPELSGRKPGHLFEDPVEVLGGAEAGFYRDVRHLIIAVFQQFLCLADADVVQVRQH